MMKYFLINLLLFLSISSVNATELCSNGNQISNGQEYTFNFTNSVCKDINDCWVSFIPPENGVKLIVNDTTAFDLTSDSSYVSNENFLLPIKIQTLNGTIRIQSRDTNQHSTFQRKLCIELGSFQALRWNAAFKWFTLTGITLYSAYFLALISIFLLFSFWFRKSGLGFSLFLYSTISTCYLISFSEYPRALIDPVIASGGFHFPLRLLQDLSLVYVFYNFYQQADSAKIIKRLSWVYCSVIGIYFFLISIGIKDYTYHSRVIIFFAPLVAAPMAIGFWFAYKTSEKTERKVLVPVSILLLIFQLNDLLVFWKLLDGYFTVRFYIPFIVGMCLFLYFRRMHAEALKVSMNIERQKLFKSFIHDLKSPLAVLRIQNIDTASKDRQLVINAALDRIENMVSKIDVPYKGQNDLKIPITSILTTVVEQKNLEHSNLTIRFTSPEEVFAFGESSELQRIFSNLINNATESYENKKALLDIDVIANDVKVVIRFTDYGKGMSKEIKARIFKEVFTTKERGQGIGLDSANRYLKSIGGAIYVTSEENLGTTIDISFNRVQDPTWFIDQLTVKNHKSNLIKSFMDLKTTWNNISSDEIISFDGGFNFSEAIDYIAQTPTSADIIYITGKLHFDDRVIHFFESQSKIVYLRSVAHQVAKDSSKLDYILIDDDRYIRLSWEYHAKNLRKNIKSYASVHQFLKDSQLISKEAVVYLDLNINGEKTTKYLEQIYHLGFQKIILATGENLKNDPTPKYVHAVSDKLPPNF